VFPGGVLKERRRKGKTDAEEKKRRKEDRGV